MVNKTVWAKGKKAELANVFLKMSTRASCLSNGVRPRENKQVRKKRGEDHSPRKRLLCPGNTTRIAYIVFKLY